ncbi:MAG: hypothetical protein CSA66_01045 [Proteobacteria bacterium]|nr:MAG: hypothetical protein CSA66_01045 [Pseudomonadota bacterium]
MKLRRLLVLAAASIFAIACGGSDSDTPPTDTSTTEDTAAEDTTPGADSVAAVDTVTAVDTALPDTQVVEDTSAPADTTPIDTTPIDMGDGICPGIRGCVAGCAGDAGCETACLDAADSAQERELYTTLQTCLIDNACDETAATDEDKRTLYECYRQCLPQIAACSAGTFGDGSCVAVGGCLGNCFEGDFRCERSCMSQGGEDAVRMFLDLDYCSLSVCYDSEDIVAMEQCVSLVGDQPVCSDPFTNCYGTTGAGTGAGAGGGW